MDCKMRDRFYDVRNIKSLLNDLNPSRSIKRWNEEVKEITEKIN